MKLQRHVLLPGELSPVPRFQRLPQLIAPGLARDCYLEVYKTMVNLGRAVQLGQHRFMIESLVAQLHLGTLVAITDRCIHDAELCAAFSVYLTTLEQIYHWPRESSSLSTPAMLRDHKLVIQVLHEPELRTMLQEAMNVQLDGHGTYTAIQIAQASLAMAGWMLWEAREAKEQLGRHKQDRVNLLHRTCRNDWNFQGSYHDKTSHLEFSRLHDVLRTNGTQRRVQEIFEETGGLAWLQRLPKLLHTLPLSTQDICNALVELQVTVMRITDELFSMMIDETIWGRTFARFSKAVGECTISAGGADCAAFRMLDALCGRADDKAQAMLLDELDFRSRFFPPNMRTLIDAVAISPSIRQYVAAGAPGGYALLQAFNALQRALWALYEMHRKKALRIVLALRAGQAKTSSGTQEALSPAQHIGGTLGEAIRVRFGSDPHALHIDAYGWSTPLQYGHQGRVEVARVRLALSTPLAVSSGDALRVGVELEKGRWETRTYSVMRAAPHCHSGEYSADAASSVEVCVRRQGVVSSFLCDQSAGFPTRVCLCPAPHFRIQHNEGADSGSVFVAQGAAAGLFIAWLERHRHSLKGQYTLIVGAQNLSRLAHAKQLKLLAASRKGKAETCLKVVVCLSAPAATDVVTLRDEGMWVHVGRVPQYIHSEIARLADQIIYVCGSASFGMNVARCFSRRSPQNQQHRRQDGRLSSRLVSISTSRLSNLRLHVAPGTVGSGMEQHNTALTARIITRSELAQHNTPNDMWLAVGDRVYDVTPIVRFHPGGEKLLSYWAGRQSDEIFALVHGDSYDVTAMLHELDIGQLAPGGVDQTVTCLEKQLDQLVEIQNDLMNNSRFEQIPTGDVAQLALAPPVDVIRGAFDTFIIAWSKLVYDNKETNEIDSLTAALNHAWNCLDNYQASVFRETFHLVERCAQALRAIFQALLATIEMIHDVLDQLKSNIADALDEFVELNPKCLCIATKRITLLVEGIPMKLLV